MRTVKFLLAILLLSALTRAEAAQPAPIDRNGVLILLRETLIALDEGNKTGNYTVLRDLSAPTFAAANTDAKLAELFYNLRKTKLDLSGVAVLEPQLTVLPEIEGNGMMHMAGFFPSAPAQINFELLYAPVDRQWRLFGISVHLGQSGPVAPEAAASAKPEPNKKVEPSRASPAPKPRRKAKHEHESSGEPAEPKPAEKPAGNP